MSASIASKKAPLTAGTNSSAITTKKPYGAYGSIRRFTPYDSQGSTTPYPSSPGTGSMFRSAAVTWRNARNASAYRKAGGTPSSASSQNGAVHTSAKRTFVSGPAAETRLCFQRPSIRPAR